MINEGKFGVHETICLVSISICNKVFFTAPGYVTRTLGTASWYMTLISCLSSVILFTFVYLLLKRFPGKSIVEAYDVSLGRVIGFVFSLVLMLFFLVYTGIFSREFVDVIKIYSFLKTPQSVLLGAMLIIASAGALLGLETIARTAKLAAYFALFGFLLVLTLSSQYFNICNIFPLLGYGLGKTVTTGVLRSTAYAEVLIIAVFAGSLQGAKHIKKAGFTSLAISGVLISLALLCFSLIFEYTSTEEVTAPIYVVATLIRYGNFLQKLDPVFLFVWIITTIIYISTMLYTAVSMFCKIFRLQDTRPVVIPMAVIAFSIAVLPMSFSSLIDQYIQGIRMIGNIPFFVMPLIALLVSVLRKKGVNSIEN